jgi:hypothetical protein
MKQIAISLIVSVAANTGFAADLPKVPERYAPNRTHQKQRVFEERPVLEELRDKFQIQSCERLKAPHRKFTRCVRLDYKGWEYRLDF